MSLSSNRVEESAGDVVAGALARSEELLVVNPSRAVMAELVDRLADTEDPPRVRLFADPDVLKALLEGFVPAATLADLVADGVVAVRTLQSVPRNSLLVSPGAVVALVPGPDRAAGLTTTDGDFVSRTYERFDRRWAAAPDYELETPPLSRVRETLRGELGGEVAADFDRLLSAVGDGSDPDAVTLCLLAAARNEQLLYDVSRWGEAVGLASKATFSRTKTALEEAGLVGTEKVPIDVGRPRLRLTLPPALAGEPVERLVREAHERL
jgi:hypothetical protein